MADVHAPQQDSLTAPWAGKELRASADALSCSWSFWNIGVSRCWNNVLVASSVAGSATSTESRSGEGRPLCAFRQVSRATGQRLHTGCSCSTRAHPLQCRFHLLQDKWLPVAPWDYHSSQAIQFCGNLLHRWWELKIGL